VLSLSWSPSWCAGDGKGDAEQCGGASSHGFVVHGLWPQYAHGGYPVRCARPAPVPEATVAEMLPLMPSRDLIEHEWRKHGTCHGIDPRAYFRQTRAAADRVRIPTAFTERGRARTLSVAAVEQLFAAVNPGLSGDAVAVVCKGRQVSELRVCLDRSLAFRPCGADVADRCRGPVEFPPIIDFHK
jgi:ribonuclease T2